MQFPYHILPGKPNPAFPNRASIARPILAITLQNGDKKVTTAAIVDSGADNCIFPASLAAQLNITVPNRRVYTFSGTADARQVAYFETVAATVWNRDPGVLPFTFDLDAGFCQSFEHVGLGLLGQNGFFSRFRIAFEHANNRFDITE